jgi:SAM-dependent methyltransferase
MKASASGIEENRALEASRSRYEEIKRIIASLISDGGYRKNSESLKTDFTEIEDDENPLFSGYEMDDDISNALPYVKRAYGKAPVMPEESEFSNWINEDLEQKYTSEKPSVNQLASVFNKVYWEPNTINLDFGGGAYQKATIFLNGKKVTNLVIDFNRTPEHNMEMRNLLDEHPADTATLANVLNVIYEEDVRQGVLKEIKKYLKTGGKLYICVYEGDKSGVGKETNKGWQENRKLSSYLPEVQNVFPNAIITKGMIICDNGALTEADMMCGFSASPFTTPYVAIPNHYHSTKEISNMTDTSGKMSPLTMLNKEEPDAEIEQLKKDQKYLQGKI